MRDCSVSNWRGVRWWCLDHVHHWSLSWRRHIDHGRLDSRNTGDHFFVLHNRLIDKHCAFRRRMMHEFCYPSLHLQSLSFSGPGVSYSTGHFGTDTDEDVLHPQSEDVSNLATTLIPSSDIVPIVDDHLGLVQRTTCSLAEPLACHKISAMVCDLLYRCGDDQNQRRFKSCTVPPTTFNKTKLEHNL